MTGERHALHLLFSMLILCALPSHAHKASDSYLTLVTHTTTVVGQWDIALRDLEVAIGIDSDGNGELTWREIQAKHPHIAAYASRLQARVLTSAIRMKQQSSRRIALLHSHAQR